MGLSRQEDGFGPTGGMAHPEGQLSCWPLMSMTGVWVMRGETFEKRWAKAQGENQGTGSGMGVRRRNTVAHSLCQTNSQPEQPQV